MTDALRLAGLEVAYGAAQILRGLSLHVRRGECVGLVGESGCGKSTAAFAALRALPAAARVRAGEILVDGQDIMALSGPALRQLRARRVSMVFQDPSRALNPTITVGAQLAEAYAVLGLADTEARAEEMLGHVQIPRPARAMRAYPHQLSGGTQQRVVIAMALAKRPALLVLDEPTTGLDATVEAEILDLIDALRREHETAVLMISHNLPMVGRFCDRVAVLYAGSLVEEGAAVDVLEAPRHPYTTRLLDCLPGRQRKRDGRLQTIKGQLPPPGAPTEPCVFAPRCDHAEAICRTEEPAARCEGTHMARCHFAPPFAARIETPGGCEVAPRSGKVPVLSVTNLTKTYAGTGGAVRAVADVSLSIGVGETLGLVGESGSGKTTLAKLLLGLVQPDAGGEIALDGAAMRQTRTRHEREAVQIVFQNPDSALNRAHRVATILARPLKKVALLGGTRRQQALEELARSVRLADAHLAMRPRALSGGLKQRVAIARAFAGRPRLVICDEPTSALDASVQAAILNLLVDLQDRDAVAYLFISHDLAVVRYLADRIAVMYLGHLLEVGPAEEVLAGPHHPYTAALVSATTEAGRIRMRGDIPRTGEQISGCIFQTNCPRKIGAICELEAPPFDAAAAHPIRCHLAAAALPALGREALAHGGAPACPD